MVAFSGGCMHYFILLALIPLGAFAAASMAGAFGASAAWPWIRSRVAACPSGDRARLLALVRLLPVGAGGATALLLVTVFVRYEPRDTTEIPGLVLLAPALTTVVLLGMALTRIVQSRRASATCSALLRQCGRPWPRADGRRIWIVDTAYPVAAVTGLVRTRLLLSTRIVRECTPGEIEAVIRHEAAHVGRRDNFIRAAMHCLPDPLALLAAGREMQDVWAAAAEEAADDEAAGPHASGRTELASALVRVARMAEGPPPHWMPALAFYEGTHLEHRVRRLLTNGPGRSGTAARRLAAAALVLATGAVLLTDGASRQIHAVMELAVQHLP